MKIESETEGETLWLFVMWDFSVLWLMIVVA